MNRKQPPRICSISDQIVKQLISNKQEASGSHHSNPSQSEVESVKQTENFRGTSPVPPRSIQPPAEFSDDLRDSSNLQGPTHISYHQKRGEEGRLHTQGKGAQSLTSSCGQETMSADSCFESQADSCSLPLSGEGSLKTGSNEESEREMNKYGNQKIVINISGTVFKATLKTLTRFPGTRLAELADSCFANPDSLQEEYYFERNPAAFADILECYRSGELHMDQARCGGIFKEELDYWGLDRGAISMCCWSKYDTHRATIKMYNELEKLFDDGTATVRVPEEASFWERIHFHVFHTLETPSFSVSARVFSVVSMLITFLSIFTFVAETHYAFQQIKLTNGTRLPVPAPEPPTAGSCCCDALIYHLTNHSPDATLNYTHNETNLEHSLHDDGHIDGHLIFHYIDFFTFGYFVFEIIIRFTFTYNKKLFCKSALNIVEVICICAHFISIIEHRLSVDADAVHDLSMSLIFVLRSLRIMRVARIFKLFRHMTGFKVLVYTIVVSIYELLLIISFLFAGVLIFASIIHYAEEETFPNIPYAIWWALVTMTTVGYGDVTPKSSLGYFIGAMCVVAGILVIAFTVPVVVNNFTLYYAVCKSRQARLKMISIGVVTEKVANVWKNKVLTKSQESYNLEI